MNHSRSRTIAKTLPLRHVFSWLLVVGCVLMSGCVQPQPEKTVYIPERETVSAYSFEAPRNPLAIPKDTLASAVPQAREVKVGLLLPLSGRHAALGDALQKAATLALFDRYAGLSPQRAATKLVLLTRDVGDTATSAREAVNHVIQRGAELIIGPVFSEHVEAVAPIARAANIPMLSFSNNPKVAGNGTYILGFSPQQQTRRIISFAVNHGVEDLAVMVPNTPYGQSVAEVARRTAKENEKTLRAEAVYAAQGVGLEAALSRVAPQKIPTFRGVFLPEGSDALDVMIRAIDTRGWRTQYGVRLLGTGLWDDAALVRRVNLEGAWLATSPPTLTQSFERRYKNVYGTVPPRIASLSYDAVSLAVTLATSGRGFSHETLTHSAGFAGPANGLFRFLEDGRSERGLAVVEINGRNFRVISPAPTAFAVR
jgi:branched-chain amino acid transport system substrate-binding protein